MSGKRRVLTSAAAAALVITALCLYWAWDPTPISRYVPHNAVMVIQAWDIEEGLENIRYEKLIALLPDDLRTAVPLPHSPIGPALDIMDVVGDRFAVFAAEDTLEDFPGRAVLVTKIGLKAKLAEMAASLIGKTHRIKTPSGRSVRTVKHKGYNLTIYYKRVDRILLVSDSVDALDAALRDAKDKTLPEPPDCPHISIRLGPGALSKLVDLAKPKKGPGAKLLTNIGGYAAMVLEMDMTLFLEEELRLEGRMVPFGGNIAFPMYRHDDYKTYAASAFGLVPGDLLFAISSGYPELHKNSFVGSRLTNTLFHEVADVLTSTSLFRGETVTAGSYAGNSYLTYLVAITDKTWFPESFTMDLRARLAARIGDVDLFDRMEGGDVYKITPHQPQYPPAYFWITDKMLVVCSSDAAFDAFAARMRLGLYEELEPDKGDLFVLADPSINPQKLLSLLSLDPQAAPFFDLIGDMRFKARAENAHVVFSANIGLHPDRPPAP